MSTEPRLDARRGALKRVFASHAMNRAWTKYVRAGFRRQEVFDLFDYNDFHWNRESRIDDLRRNIVSGRYQPRPSIPVKVEKKLGVCRTIVIPTPEDALVLQCIVESLLKQAIRRQPSRNTFFSRSHSNNVEKFEFDREYIWFKQWRRFANLRLQLGSVHQWVATTDIATFFDNINHVYLRNILSSFDGQHEVILDILLNLLDRLGWRPDYLPSPSVGLPQVQFDAPRLLAHIYLFEIDELMKDRTADKFVRWVDDITLAVESEQAGKLLLRDLDTLLQMRGLRLNSGKTHIMSASQAAQYFHRLENKKVDDFADRVKKLGGKDGKARTRLVKDIKNEFKGFVEKMEIGQGSKVVSRYIGLASDLRSDFAVKFVKGKFTSHPDLRDAFYRYLSGLGPRVRTFSIIDSYVRSEHAIDDASICHLSQILVDWELGAANPIRKRVQELVRFMRKKAFLDKSPHRFSAALVLNVKYESEARLIAFVRRNSPIWSRSEYLTRQVCAASARVRDLKFLEECGAFAAAHGFRSATAVVDEITKLRSSRSKIDKGLRGYLLNGKNSTTYKIHRFLIALSVLRAPKIAMKFKSNLKSDILTYIKDPFYRAMIQRA
jgi:hypothetical protein